MKIDEELVDLLIQHGANAGYNNSQALREYSISNNANINIIEKLINAGANIRDNDNAAIQMAVKFDKFKLVRYFLDKIGE